MIEYRKSGSLFDSGADALVNPVNCVGVSGAGLALAFAKRFPLSQKEYETECNEGKLYPGLVLSTTEGIVGTCPFIIYFPTKALWKDPSKIEYIHDGLVALRQELTNFHERGLVDSAAIPALGCGLGRLSWSEVKEEIGHCLSPVKGITFYVYEPQ